MFARFCEPDAIRVAALTGSSGAGKSVLSRELLDYSVRHGIDVTVLPLDYFFRYSREDRNKWVQAPLLEGDADEYIRRVISPQRWNFDQVLEAIYCLSRGQDVKVAGAYNRSDEGRMTLDATILAPRKEGLVVLDGAMISPLLDASNHPLDGVAYLFVDAPVRTVRFATRSRERVTPQDMYFNLMDTQFRDDHELARVLDALIRMGDHAFFVDNRSDPPSLMHPVDGDYPLLRAIARNPFNGVYIPHDVLARNLQEYRP